MTLNYTTNSPEETENIGFDVAKILDESNRHNTFIAMRGEMGVGKTALTRGFCRYFDITNVKSPTYAILNQYIGKTKVNHFDFYRIMDEDDLYSIGYEDIISGGGYIIAEWSENIPNITADDKIQITISRVGFEPEHESIRNITVEL